MPSRILALSAGGVVIVGAAVAGGYFIGHLNNPQPQPVQTGQAPAPPAQPYPQESEQPPANEAQANYPAGYSRSVYSPWTNEGGTSQRSARHRPHRVSFQYFRDSLSPYGHWMHSDRWGEVWQPTQVESDFHPYERGHWANTREFGWTWASDYEWGDIPFHYGRWVDDPERGWVWVPGYVWGPGWVVWRTGSHHTGWMPMPPDDHFLRGEENERVDWSRERDDYGYRDWYGSDYDQNRLDSHWVYVDTGHFADPDYRRYEVRRPDEIRQLSIQTHDATNYVTVDNFVVNRSVNPSVVEQQSGHRIEAVPATQVIKKPELVAPVNTGTQIAVATHQDIPAGTGKPHSAPPANPVALNAPPPPPNAPLPQTPANAPGNMTPTPGPANAPTKPSEQKPNTSASTNAGPNAAASSAAATSAPPTPQQAQQQEAPNNQPFTRHHHEAPGFAQRPGQPQEPAAPNVPSKPSSATATAQPPAPQQQTQQLPSAPSTAKEEKHHHGGPMWMQQGASQGQAQNAPTNSSPPASSPPLQQAQQPSANGSQSASGPGEERFLARHGHGRKETEQGTETAPSGAAQNAVSGSAASSSQQPATAQEERKAKREEKKGEVVPSSLPPGSPSPYAPSPNAKSNAGGEGAAQDQSGADQKHKKHREKGDNPDEGGTPQQQQ